MLTSLRVCVAQRFCCSSACQLPAELRFQMLHHISRDALVLSTAVALVFAPAACLLALPFALHHLLPPPPPPRYSLPCAVDVGRQHLDKAFIHPLPPALLIRPAAATAAAGLLATQPASTAAGGTQPHTAIMEDCCCAAQHVGDLHGLHGA